MSWTGARVTGEATIFITLGVLTTTVALAIVDIIREKVKAR